MDSGALEKVDLLDAASCILEMGIPRTWTRDGFDEQGHLLYQMLHEARAGNAPRIGCPTGGAERTLPKISLGSLLPLSSVAAILGVVRTR